MLLKLLKSAYQLSNRSGSAFGPTDWSASLRTAAAAYHLVASVIASHTVSTLRALRSIISQGRPFLKSKTSERWSSSIGSTDLSNLSCSRPGRGTPYLMPKGTSLTTGESSAMKMNQMMRGHKFRISWACQSSHCLMALIRWEIRGTDDSCLKWLASGLMRVTIAMEKRERCKISESATQRWVEARKRRRSRSWLIGSWRC